MRRFSTISALAGLFFSVAMVCAADDTVLAKLEELGLAPSPEADPTTLIRRLAMDLLGLPPSPEEVAARNPRQIACFCSATW